MARHRSHSVEFKRQVAQEFLSGAGEENGFFDALSNGPVSATDPRALGGDLVGANMGPQQ